MAAEAERDRDLYVQRVALAEEGQELAQEDRKQLQVLCSRRRAEALDDVDFGRVDPSSTVVA